MMSYLYTPLSKALIPWLTIVIVLVSPNAVYAQSSSSKEVETTRALVLKAGMINGFIGYTNWPKSVQKSRYIIGVLGENEAFITALERFFNKKPMIGGKDIVVRRLALEQVSDCHLLVIFGEQNRYAKQVIDELKGKPVLTVSDDESFTRKGGHISFFSENNRLRFEINWQAANRAKLKISSRLLKLARVTGK